VYLLLLVLQADFLEDGVAEGAHFSRCLSVALAALMFPDRVKASEADTGPVLKFNVKDRAFEGVSHDSPH
jgi:hypothetical protein